MISITKYIFDRKLIKQLMRQLRRTIVTKQNAKPNNEKLLIIKKLLINVNCFTLLQKTSFVVIKKSKKKKIKQAKSKKKMYVESKQTRVQLALS